MDVTDKTRRRDELLDEMFKKRGYLLPYHRLLGELDPDLLATYDTLYTRLTLNERALTLKDREVVWIALIAVTREKYATFHLERGVDAGMSNDDIRDAMAIGAACESFDALNFGHQAFGKWVQEDKAMSAYFALFDAAKGQTPAAIAEIAAVVCFASWRNEAGMRVHLARAFEFGAQREQVAEGLSYILLHKG